MGRSKLSDEEKKARKRAYYQRNKEKYQQKARDKYNAEERKEYYDANRKEIREQQKISYVRCRQAKLLTRLEDLKKATSATYMPLIDFLIDKKLYQQLHPNEIDLLENILLLATQDDVPEIQTENPPKNEIIIPEEDDEEEEVDELSELLRTVNKPDMDDEISVLLCK